MVKLGATSEGGVLWAVAVLTFAAGFTAQFFAQGVTLFLREAGVASSVIGLIYIAAIPYTLRFVWAPLIDRTSLGGPSRFGRWIISSLAALCAALALLSLFDPATNAMLIITGVGLGMLILGTLQTALGGLMVEGLSQRLYPRGASMQAAMSAAAGMVLGGCVLYLIGPFGWAAVVWSLVAVSVGVLLLALTFLNLDHQATEAPQSTPRLYDQFSIFKDKRARKLLGVSICVSAAVVLPYAMKPVLLIDAGFDVAQSGLIGIVGGNAAGFFGAVVARPLVEQLGGLRVLTILAILNVLIVGTFTLVSKDTLLPFMIVLLVLFANLSVFAAYTASRSVLMPLCQPGQQATHLAGFVGAEAVLFLIIAGASISSLDKVGLTTILCAGIAASVLGAFLASRVGKEWAQQGEETIKRSV
ncbi:MAG: MFS transporter [Pseudomonadota bacterium]